VVLKFKLIIFVLILFWNIGLFVLPLSHIFEKAIYAFPVLNDLYGNVCHQEIPKTIHINDSPLQVCARCSGIYFSAFVFSLLSFIVSKKFYQHRFLISGVIIIVIIDVMLTTFGILDYSKISAFATGFLLGSVSFIYFYNALIELVSKKQGIN
jgi:uncharacterized membrane protein